MIKLLVIVLMISTLGVLASGAINAIYTKATFDSADYLIVALAMMLLTNVIIATMGDKNVKDSKESSALSES